MSPRLTSLFVILSFTGLAAVHAADDATAAKPPAYVLKHKSTFTALGEDERAPFWPIGWTKRKAAPTSTTVRVVEAPKVLLDEKNFKVSSILLGSPSFAIINGRTYSEGEFLRSPRAAAIVPALPAGARVRVYRINDGAVVLQNQEQLLTVMLRRPELSERKAEEELLLDDRP